ncbi:MAG: hypothetical protein LBT37_01005 [Lactobacillaceae bacterium]|jgi:hypothetical protein|nr:hypothetical protein [Lactobacillaceae bacterium]
MKKMFWPTLLGLVPILLGILLWNQLPKVWPSGLGLNITVLSRGVGIFYVPVLLVVCNLIANNRSRWPLIGKYERWIMPIDSCIIQAAVMLVVFGVRINLGLVMAFVLLLSIGLAMADIKDYKIIPRKRFLKLPSCLVQNLAWNRMEEIINRLSTIILIFVVISATVSIPILISYIILVVILIYATITTAIVITLRIIGYQKVRSS